MGTTVLMSYPGRNWQVRGGANARSQGRPPTNPRAALKEWLTLADGITRVGGRILVIPPADEALTGLVYTANAGAMFRTGDEWVFLIAKMAVPHRAGERAAVAAYLQKAGVPTAEATRAWEGQADLQTLKASRYLLTWGVRSAKESVEEVRGHLQRGARSLDIQLREPWQHGDSCLAPLFTRAGDLHVLVYGGAMVNRNVPELRSFVSTYADILPVDEDDARACACNALSVDGTVFMLEGSSPNLRGNLVHRGFNIEELALPELFGKGGGGPRSLVNVLHGFVISEDAPSYVHMRENILALVDQYPEASTPAAAPST